MSGEAVALRQVRFSYGVDPLIEGLDLSLEEGCLTGIVGPNGCGKSTLLRIAGGLLAPQSGQVKLMGKRLEGLRAAERARLVALLPQDTPAVSMPVAELAVSGRYAHAGLLQAYSPADRRAADRALELTGMSELAARPVRALSGGQRQRAYLAMLLAQQSPVMLLDEPTSALDIRAAHDILALVRDVRAKRNATVAIVMHDLDLALRYCDRLVVMHSGRVVEHGSVSDVVGSGALERVFRIALFAHDTPVGAAYTFAPDSRSPSAATHPDA